MIIKYEARDGQVFFDEDACRNYEAKLDKAESETVTLLNRFCKFFDTNGNQIILTNREPTEGNIYGVSIKNCSKDEAEMISSIFENLFEDLHWALYNSDFDVNNEVILVYDWTTGIGWTEIDMEKQEWHNFVTKIIEGA